MKTFIRIYNHNETRFIEINASKKEGDLYLENDNNKGRTIFETELYNFLNKYFEDNHF